MGKSDSDAEVIALSNEQVNMTADELEKWLEDPQSRDAGTGVGIESGRRIVEILRDKNPTKNPDAYDEEDIAHIRKVVSYNSRHLAQEDHLKETKTTAQLAKAKSTISLKNWGHDPVKVKLQRESETSPKNDADAHSSSTRISSISGGGDSDDGEAEADNRNATSPDNERDRQHRDRDRDQDQDRDRDRVHDSEEDADADGEVDTQTQTQTQGTNSDTDTFEDAEIGQKRPLHGPPAGAGGAERRRRKRGGHASGERDSDHGTGGQNKRLHTGADA